MNKKFAFLALLLIPSSFATAETGRKSCMYTSADGMIHQVNSPADVPPEFAESAKCFSSREKPAVAPVNQQPSSYQRPLRPQYSPGNSPLQAVRTPASGQDSEMLAAPEDIKLSGSQRSELINSSLGPVTLRWPRKVETLFGRTPLRAMTDAANTVSRALKNGAFPTEIQSLTLDLKVIFLDENLPAAQIPQSLITDCHPGWMTPPANIYIVAQRVAGGCSNQRSTTSVADSTVGDVLIHELGHVVEFHMLGGRATMDRMRAEGFATWFEEYAAQYSSVVSASELKRHHSEVALAAIQQSPNSFTFGGTESDYDRAAMYFRAIAAPRGLSGVVDVYKRMNSTGRDFRTAINDEFHWDERRLNKEVLEAARSR